MIQTEALFEHWNTKPAHKNWRSHRIFTPGMKRAARRWLLEGYTVGYLAEAIDNYYSARTTPGSWWCDVCKQKWDFETFFKGGERKAEYNWKRFEPERFDLNECFTPEHKRKMAKDKNRREQLEEIERWKAMLEKKD